MAAPKPSRSRSVLALLLFLFGLATTALPLLAPRFPATQDGGAHQNSAMVLAALENHPSTLFERVYALRDTPPSNQLAARLMAWIAELGGGADAGRLLWLLLFTTACAVIVVNLLRWGRLAYAPLLFPVFAGELVSLGFENYLIGVVFFIQAAFTLQAGLRRPSVPWVAAMAGLAALTYLGHPFTGVALAIAAAAIGASLLLRRWFAGGNLRRLVLLACVLTGLVVTVFAVSEAWAQILRFVSLVAAHGPAATSPGTSVPSDSELLRDHLLMLVEFGLLSYSRADFLFVAAFLLILVWLAVHRVRVARSAPGLEDHWLAAMAALFAVCAFVPRAFEPFLPVRILACFLVVTVLWLASAPPGPRARAALLALGLLFDGAWCAYRLWWSTATDPILAEFASAGAAIPEHATVAEVIGRATPEERDCLAVVPRRLPCNAQPTLHFVGQLLGARDVAELQNYQLDRGAGFFPIDLRPPWTDLLAQNLWLSNWPPEDGGTPVETAAAAIRRLAPDVILAWDERRAADPATASPFRESLAPLLAGYDLAFRSQPLGLASVYRRSGVIPAAGPAPTTSSDPAVPASSPGSPPAAPPR